MKEDIKDTLCFGLDIGTRTVIGVVGYKEGNEFILVDYECRAHEERAMRDGQIHDINKVSKVVYEVKTALEKRLNLPLKEVAIAAAGRALNTQIVTVTQNYEDVQEITLNHIHHLELEGVEKAKAIQQSENTDTDYFCVAYSVIQYFLDDYVMTNLEGHRGHNIAAKLIVTFLPKQVIDSLYAVTDRADLTVSHLTLEPIAAINAVIPEQIRLLNLALVDVGAGTSDIAITREGSVVAYGMIPTAGDEVTEAIIHKYLVDFKVAEQLKIQSLNEETITFTDVLGITQKVTAKELRKVIAPVIDTLTLQIATKIVELNGNNPPNAIFCVGGGSQMVGFTTSLAQHLKLAQQRVAVRSTTHLVNVKDEIGMIDSPEMITPLGICMTTLQNKYSQFTFVSLNGQKVQLLNAKKLTVLDAIVAVGIEHTAVFPKKGETLMFKLNGERKRIKGENGTPASILLNGVPATIHDHIQEGDTIQIELGVNGTPGKAKLADFYKIEKNISIEGKSITLPLAKVGGLIVSGNYEIMPNDMIEVVSVETVGELLDAMVIDPKNKLITIDFKAVDLDYVLKEGDALLIDTKEENHQKAIAESSSDIVSEKNRTLVVDDFNLSKSVMEKEVNKNLYIIANDTAVALPKKESDYIFASIFDFIDFDLSKPQGIVQLERNGQPGALTDVLQDGDILKIYWKK